jgi:hypothetical protein
MRRASLGMGYFVRLRERNFLLYPFNAWRRARVFMAAAPRRRIDRAFALDRRELAHDARHVELVAHGLEAVRGV